MVETADHRIHPDAAVFPPVSAPAAPTCRRWRWWASCSPGTSPGDDRGRSDRTCCLGWLLRAADVAIPLVALGSCASSTIAIFHAGRRITGGGYWSLCRLGRGFTKRWFFDWSLFQLLQPDLQRCLCRFQVWAVPTDGGGIRRFCFRSTITWAPMSIFNGEALFFAPWREFISG